MAELLNTHRISMPSQRHKSENGNTAELEGYAGISNSLECMGMSLGTLKLILSAKDRMVGLACHLNS